VAASAPGHPAARAVERLGRGVVRGVSELGFGAGLLVESITYLLLGRRLRQPVRLAPLVAEMMEVGVRALPIVTVLGGTIGAMLAIQGIDTLRDFGAESQVVIGIALGVTREFAPLITGIVVAGRSGSALAARLATMTVNQEVDALRVIGIQPVRFLVAPSLVAMVVMLPALTFWTDCVAILCGGLYVGAELGASLGVYTAQALEVLDVGDVLHGLGKAVLFAVLIAIVGAVNGSSVTGGAEGVGRVTTRSVVHAISAIVITDMLFAFVSSG